MFRSLLTAFLVCGVLLGPALGQDKPAQNSRNLMVKVARDFIIPRYETLAESTLEQQQAWDAFCAAPQAGNINTLKSAYQKAADAWSGIEFVLYGPISIDFRFEKMAHWPERKNAVSRSLNAILNRTGTDDLTPERFAQVSAASQGLSAIERLLFEQDSIKALTENSDAKRRCAVGQAIAGALARTSGKVLDEWREPEGTLAKLEKGDAGVVDEATTRLATDYITLFEIIDDQKLGSVMGKEPDEARGTLAEGWRSGRSMRAIAVNLEAAQGLAKILVDESQDENTTLFYALRSSHQMAESLQGSIGDMASDSKKRRNLVLLRDSVHSLREVAEYTVPTALGVTMGFNSRDGD